MANPEQVQDKPVSKPGVESNVSVQDGADKVYGRSGARGRNTILLISLLLALIVGILVARYLF
ncbi:MAG: hypothetical protein AVDCRST_MAG86-2907 [uncultured Truepera sp.]|uniref:Uncharacterized protein n=1 Tax=uncultured Truepera sp. TaxID=543023 RepID=A0A6J4VHD7_9DEIN|nr:MAG: hypothetical protein AVDCRST_MAG86-2907 [uncultured Truepera sp.]